MVAGIAALGWTWGALPVARAEGESEPITVTVADCKVRGTNPVAKGTPIFDRIQGGRVIATFSGALAPLTVSAFPLTDRAARARVSTTDGTPSFRIDGFVDPTKIDLYTSRDLPVVGNRVAISGQQRVRFLGATADALRVERSILGTREQVLSVSAPCDAFSFGLTGLPPAPDSKGARAYRMRVTTMDLYDAPAGRVVFTLQMEQDTTLLFWGRDARRGFVHVFGRSDVVIDAWVRLRNLEAMHPGELMTPFVPAPLKGAELGLTGETTTMVAPKDVPIRTRPEPEEPTIGVIEAGTEYYSFAPVDGWVRVLPKSLMVKSTEDASFWVKQTDIMP